MLEPRHILSLKLDKWRVTSHMALPPPRHASTTLTGQFSAIGGTIITTLLGVDINTFGDRLIEARKLGAEYICTLADGRNVGLSVSTSLVKRHGDLLCKNLIVPETVIYTNTALSERIVISAFVFGEVVDGVLEFDGGVEIAGWATALDIKSSPTQLAPATFTTKLKHIIALPCKELRPISELVELLHGATSYTYNEENQQHECK